MIFFSKILNFSSTTSDCIELDCSGMNPISKVIKNKGKSLSFEVTTSTLRR